MIYTILTILGVAGMINVFRILYLYWKEDPKYCPDAKVPADTPENKRKDRLRVVQMIVSMIFVAALLFYEQLNTTIPEQQVKAESVPYYTTEGYLYKIHTEDGTHAYRLDEFTNSVFMNINGDWTLTNMSADKFNEAIKELPYFEK